MISTSRRLARQIRQSGYFASRYMTLQIELLHVDMKDGRVHSGGWGRFHSLPCTFAQLVVLFKAHVPRYHIEVAFRDKKCFSKRLAKPAKGVKV